MAKDKKATSFKDIMLAAFRARDAGDDDELAKQLQAAEGAMKTEPDGGSVAEPEGSDSEGAGNHHHVTVNIGGLEGGDKTKDEDTTGEAATEEAAPDVEEMLKRIVGEAVAPLAARMDALESALEEASDPEDAATQDAVARAEVLRPGFKMPTFDAAPGSKAQKGALHSMKVAVLKEAFGTVDGRAVIGALVTDARPDFSKYTPREVDTIFRAASERARDANNGPLQAVAGRGGFGVVDAASGEVKRKAMDARGLNEYYAKHYGRA